MKNQIMLFRNLFFVASMFVLVLNSVEAADNIRCRENERRALLEFKAGIVDDQGVLSSWGNSSKECCNWRGIRCSNRTHHVTLLNLPGYVNELTEDAYISIELRGKISPSLSELIHLKYLNLSHNGFSGKIPPQLGNLTNLLSLDLGLNIDSGLYVEYLDWVSGLHLLKHLDLSYVNLSGCNDWLNQIYKLSSLTHLHLSSCHLPDPSLSIINNSFPAFNSLVVADLSYNDFISPKSYNWLFNFTTTLVSLDLSWVNLSGCNDWLNQIYELSSLTHLHLSGCGLRDQFGPFINTSIPAFNSLVVADLPYNDFISPKSYNWLFNFTTTLVSLDLSRNSFPRSEIPEAIGRIISLQSLRLIGCKLEGMLPEFFSNLTRLATLNLIYNNLTGSLSEFLHPLATKEKNSLQVLYLQQNQLDGSLPDYFPRFPSLQRISIANNKLSGSFPKDIWQVSSSLVYLDLSHNQLSGPLPNLTLFSSLVALNLRNNKLEGTIPETYLSNLSKLISLDLSFNSLSLKTSVYWVPPFQLGELYLHNCTVGPHFPSWLQSQRKISMLAISSAGISDTIPLWFWDILPRVEYLDISNNNIQGPLPDLSFMSMFDDSIAEIIDMSYNNLTGPIPKLPVSLGYLDLSQNMFTGSLSFLCTTSYNNFESIRLSDNQLSGELPDCWINVQGLVELNLANNSFSGELPASIGLLKTLHVLQLRNNSLSGELSSALTNCSKLRLLDLSENEFSGEVPTWIGTHLTNLIVFSLSKNNFLGRVPPQICLLTDVQVLDLSRNNLSRSIPNCVNNISALTHSEDYPSNEFYFLFERISDNDITTVPSAYVQWKGQESSYRRHTLGLLKLIDFSSNRLVGKIPEEYASLKGLMSLNLSSNNFNGNIIPNIGQMNNLEVLDLSGNNLSGEIPASLSNLTFLSVLDLSKNKLRGRIPLSTQLQSFDPSSYAANDLLCGLPLRDKCPNDRTKVFSPSGEHGNDEHNEDYEDRLITMWFYISLVLGFITGFWGFIGPVMLRSTWRHAYSRFLEKITDRIYLTTSVNMARLQRKL